MKEEDIESLGDKDDKENEKVELFPFLKNIHNRIDGLRMANSSTYECVIDLLKIYSEKFSNLEKKVNQLQDLEKKISDLELKVSQLQGQKSINTPYIFRDCNTLSRLNPELRDEAE